MERQAVDGVDALELASCPSVELGGQVEEQVGLRRLLVVGEGEDLAGLLADEEAVAGAGHEERVLEL